jgi:hypothetical protein
MPVMAAVITMPVMVAAITMLVTSAMVAMFGSESRRQRHTGYQ